ncbi:hypothetical protein [Pseudonocardia hydrocarbonoxydans]|uniref:Uncharacterized protein n=1 Tax=Pseudonocardia hydrocarbonoxydans TaxID=76726 RepID=A0A4Y3WSW2_9PSEU|nr:hypothetical protein [Pseudonocardia hydrocarbonoxydans]GEC21864.1 hypothetical protein PHY01_41470 [Pseudonocardia hydrocarbonoxydans]
MSAFPYPQTETAEDVEALMNHAAQIAADRGRLGSDGAAYAFALASLAVNSVFAGSFPDSPPTHRQGLYAV